MYQENLRLNKLLNERERTIKNMEKDMKNVSSSNEENKKLRMEIIQLTKTINEKDNKNKELEKALGNKDAEKEKALKDLEKKLKIMKID